MATLTTQFIPQPPPTKTFTLVLSESEATALRRCLNYSSSLIGKSDGCIRTYTEAHESSNYKLWSLLRDELNKA